MALLSPPHPLPAQFSVSTASLLVRRRPSTACQVCTPKEAVHRVDPSALTLAESLSENELWAAACLRVRSFYQFKPSTFGLQDHRRYLAEREFEAMKERVGGKRKGFRRVSCINASVPLSQISSLSVSDEFCAECKFNKDGEDRVVVGTLDLNQCVSLPDEITGIKPEGIGADFARAYLSNVCVAKELHRNGLGYALVSKSKLVAQEWGKRFDTIYPYATALVKHHSHMLPVLYYHASFTSLLMLLHCYASLGISDLYVHVAVDNEPAKKLYMKNGFVYENDEPAWQARFLDRPRRILLWFGIPGLQL